MAYILYDRIEGVRPLGKGGAAVLRATLPPDLVERLIEDKVLDKDARGRSIPYSVRGTFLEPRTGMIVRCAGEFRLHERFGLQFEAESVQEVRPKSMALIREYFESAKIVEISPEVIEHLMSKFGAGIFQALGDSEALKAVGISPNEADRITRAWERFAAPHDLQTLLVDLELVDEGAGILRQFHDRADVLSFTKRAKVDPYRLVDVGVEFAAVDRAMLVRGAERSASERVLAAALGAYAEAYENGNTIVPRRIIESSLRTMTGLPTQVVAPILDEGLRAADRLVACSVKGETYIARRDVHAREQAIAKNLTVLAGARSPVLKSLSESEAEGLLACNLNAEQCQAVINAFAYPVSVITGGPGVGKTRVLEEVVRLAQAQGARVALAAPGGKAARRMTEATGHPSSTIHSLLHVTPDGSFEEGIRIDADLLVVDETSMVDVDMMLGVTRALAPGQHVLFVGDVDQLPSIRAGQVLSDMIHAGVTTTRLTQNYRTEAPSIIEAATRINAGMLPTTWDDNFSFKGAEDQDIPEAITQSIVACLKEGYTLGDIMVLAPRRVGNELSLVSVNALNPYIQEIVNPPSSGKVEIAHRKRDRTRMFRSHDRVIFGDNDYVRGLFNGDIGEIISLDSRDGSALVRFDDKAIQLEKDALYNLELAYATTVHQAQGDQFPVVILAVAKSSKFMFYRSLAFTGVTRAKKRVICIGDKETLAHAVKTEGIRRMTGLAPFLIETRREIALAPG